MADKHVIAIDLGASNGRVMQVSFDGNRFDMTEVHRFPNTPVTAHGTLYWDALRLWHDIQEGLERIPKNIASMGVDSWGVDFALVDKNGHLLSSPVHYRDRRTEHMTDWVFDRVPRRTVFERTGIQIMALNTLYQLASLVESGSPLLDCAATLLTLPNLFNYWLTGTQACEYTHATTTQCYSPHTADWDYDTLAALAIPTGMFPTIIPPGTLIGTYKDIPVIAPACHDSGSAAVAVPTTTPNYVFISSGTWSVMGLETEKPVINDAVYDADITNEGGVYNTIRLLQNVMGLWLQQQCRSTWKAEGALYDYDELIAQAQAAEPFRSLIIPSDPAFLAPGAMPERIRQFCRQTGQAEPETVGQFIRTIYESLALKYREVLDTLISLTGRTVDQINVIGGGSQNTLLCQMTADATGRVVIAGPVEATALGNALVQLITLGDLDNITQARALLAQMPDTRTYEPQHTARWDDAFVRYCDLEQHRAS